MNTNESYCTLAQYIDEQFICWGTGKPCTLHDMPNQYICSKYSHLRKDTDYGSIWKLQGRNSK